MGKAFGATDDELAGACCDSSGRGENGGVEICLLDCPLAESWARGVEPLLSSSLSPSPALRGVV